MDIIFVLATVAFFAMGIAYGLHIYPLYVALGCIVLMAYLAFTSSQKSRYRQHRKKLSEIDDPFV